MQTLIASFILNQGRMPPPRVSRLHKAALTLLVAATAAVFVCAPACAIPVADEPPVEDPPVDDPPVTEIQIVNMGQYYPLSSDAIEGEWHTVYASTNTPYHQVKWYVNGDLKKTYTNTPTTSNTYSYFDYEYDGLGSTAGNSVTIKAVATGWGIEFGLATKEMTITVWDPIRIRSVGNRDNCVAGERFSVWAHTNIPFTRVEYTIGGQSKVHNGDGSSKRSAVEHDFGKGDGSEEGEVYAITAVAYATVAGREISSEAATSSITVHEGRGKILKSVWGYVSYFNMDKVLETLTLYSSHGIRYYNDTEDEEGSIYALHILYEKDPEGDDRPERRESDEEDITWTLALAWHDTAGYVTVENGTDFDGDMNPYEPVTMIELVRGYVYYALVSSRINWRNRWANSDDDSVMWNDFELTDERRYPGQWDEGYNSSTYNP